jgi:hypothetical protein
MGIIHQRIRYPIGIRYALLVTLNFERDRKRNEIVWESKSVTKSVTKSVAKSVTKSVTKA